MTAGRPTGRLALALTLGLAGMLTIGTGAGCRKAQSDEDQVRAVIRRAIEAANEKKAGDVVEDAASDFAGPRGADLRECRRILTGYFLQKGWLKVFEQRLEVQVEGTSADAKLEVVVARGTPVTSIEDVVPKQASRLSFDLKLRKRDGAWLFTNADYQERPLVAP